MGAFINFFPFGNIEVIECREKKYLCENDSSLSKISR